MGELYVYADETGSLEFEGQGSAKRYFGFGTATFGGDHRDQIWEGLQLRCHLEASGVSVPKGLHAKDDSRRTRAQVFEVIRTQAPRFDTTFLAKSNAYGYVRTAGPVRLYKLAWFLHMKYVVPRISSPDDTIYVIVGKLQTHNKRGSSPVEWCTPVIHWWSV